MVLLVYSRIVWNPPPPTPAVVDLEELLEEFVALSIEYDAQKKNTDEMKEELDTIKYVYFRDISHLDDLEFDIDQCKKKMMALKFNWVPAVDFGHGQPEYS